MVLEKKQLSKTILAIALSIATAVAFMPMFGGFAYAAEGDVTVTTDQTTEPIAYNSFDEALSAVLEYETENAVITLNADQEVATEEYVGLPLTINLNGHKLNGSDKLEPAAEPLPPEDKGEICRGDSETAIVFAKHNPGDVVYNWEQASDGSWAVVSESTACENCGTFTTKNLSGEMVVDETSEEGKIFYNYVVGGKVVDSKTVEVDIASKYTLSGEPRLVTVNGKIQHKDGLPVVEATLLDVDGNEVTPDITLTAATDKEITDNHLEPNAEATCVAQGKIWYKVVVKDPNGKVVGDEAYFLQDTQVGTPGEHKAGKLAGLKFLTKGSTAYSSQAEAQAASGTVKVTSEVVDGVAKYYAWAYGAVQNDPTIDVTSAVDADGSFTYIPVYNCDFIAVDKTNTVDGEAVTVKPFADAATAAEAADGNHSLCVKWAYPSASFTYEYTKNVGDVVKTKETKEFKFANVDKPEAAFSHKDDGTQFTVTQQPTCSAEGKASVKCAICGEAGVPVTIDKLADTFGAFTGETPKANVIDPLCNASQVVELNAAKTEATITATCVYPGGTYKYCTGENNGDHGHWVLQNRVEASGHNWAPIITNGKWSPNTDSDYVATDDYTFTATQKCGNDGCTEVNEVIYHSAKGTDTLNEKFSAVTVDDQLKGKDCKTNAKTVYSVEGLKWSTGKAVTKEYVKTGDSTLGDHSYTVVGWNWNQTLDAAMASLKCALDATHTAVEAAKISKSTAASGLTTFTATFGTATDTKTGYTLEGAEVTYDKTKLTDGNLVLGVEDYAAPQTPDVTVKINGTVIDASAYDVEWTYAGNTAQAVVTWAKTVPADEIVEPKSAASETYKVAKKAQFKDINTTVKGDADLEEDGTYYAYYAAGSELEVVTSTAVKGATVKYAVETTKAKDQKAIEALEYSADSVKLSKAGTYYVYAQVSAEGYTTYSGLVAPVEIEKAYVTVSIDNATMKQGETPTLNMTVLQGGTRLDVPQSEFVITSVGGVELEKLLPGEYKLLVTSDNYRVETEFIEGRVGSITVLTKEGKTAEQDAKDTAAAADKSLASAKAVKKANYTAASYAAVTKAAKDLEAAIASGSTEKVKEATAALNKAVSGLVAKKAQKITKVTPAKKTYKANKKTKKLAKAYKFTLKVKATPAKGGGKVTFKKANKVGKSLITVSKAGKVTVKKGLKKGTYKVKVKATKAANANYKVATKTVTVKIIVK